MSNDNQRTELISHLADLLNDKGLTEIEFDAGDWRVRVSKQGTLAAAQATIPAIAPMPGQHALAPVGAAEPASDDLGSHPGAVTSPMVGIAYLRPDPDSPPFIEEGATVTQGQTLLLIEAMKVYNPIHAPKAGKVTKILFDSGSPVEFGEPLVIIE